MANLAKTIVATGATSGLGFELVKQLLAQTQPYKFILGARDTQRTQAAYDELQYDSARHSLTILPLELADLATVKSFAQQALQKLGQDPVDYLVLNAGMARNDDAPGSGTSRWSDSYLVNHLSQHYLTHLLRPKLEASGSRIVVVSSGAIRGVTDTSVLDQDNKRHPATERSVYSATKFTQLLGAHWWQRALKAKPNTKCTVVAVSPGLIPGTNLARHMAAGQQGPDPNHPDAKSVATGAQSILAALTRDDLPADPEQLFLTSWGEWWPKDVYGLSLDKELQDKWCPGVEEIEREEGISA
ncbi:NAD(P)-binding protein [Apiospora hydei]|uniref:NAD(P)-binding protein n=1 Tax=Apiospora hydei TaxID=1337664 RepID=A0ABR1VJP2_9PEZI